MGKRRSIDSRIRSSQTFAALTYRQRDLWQGMIEVGADDQGRMPGYPAYVRSMIWPYDDIPLSEVDADLARLELLGNISQTSFTLIPQFSQLTSSVFSPFFSAPSPPAGSQLLPMADLLEFALSARAPKYPPVGFEPAAP